MDMYSKMTSCLFLFGFVTAILASCPVPAHAVKLPVSSGPATTEKRTSSEASTTAPVSNEQIDALIATIKARENELRAHPLSDGINLKSGLPGGVTPEEYQEWQRLTAKVTNLLESRIMNLRFLKDARQAGKDLETQRKGWRGFSEKPPYPLTLLDSLQDIIKARQIEIHTLEMRLAISEGELADYTTGLRESRTEQRLAGERLEQSLGKPEEERLRWLLALASRRNDVNETGAVTQEAQRQMLQESLALLRQEITFLDQKFAQAASNFHFTREELDKKLKALDIRRTELKQELENALKAEDNERAEQEKIRISLQRYKDRTSSATVSQRLETLRETLAAQQVRVETAGLRVMASKILSRLVVIEGTAWKNRFQLANPGKDTTPPDIVSLQKDQETLKRVKEYLRARLEGVDNHIRSQETRISSGDLGDVQRGNARILLAGYREQRNIMFRVDEQISGVDQFLKRFAGELSARNDKNRSVSTEMKNLQETVLSYAGKIWNMDLYVAEETLIVDGQKIITSRSVTVGKVIKALLIFFIGIAVTKKCMRPVRRFAARKFNLNENDAQVFGRVTYYILFVCILVFSLITVNIPLAVFAFMGGALAIGVGFGAQTLISNFIAGLILLFDRAISINDVVEVDGQRGRVTAINIRSSRVKRFDGIEILIPNSHFLQQNVVNLTLSDPFTRFEIAVGVAYGTPTRIAEETIFQAVVDQPEVRKDPPPYVAFEDFADSSLIFRAFFWIDLHPDVNSNIIRSEIRHRISEYLGRANISIPFPQRDLHLGTSQPLEIMIRGERDART